MTPQELKASILQRAMQGKLVEHIASDGDARDIIKEIELEKKALVKQGVAKKDKILSEITEDEMPFDLPDSWVWMRLRTVVFNRGQMVPNTTFSYIDIGSIDNQRQCLSSEENIIEADKAPSRARKIVKYGDILYSTVRPYLHNMCIIDKEYSCMPIASTGFAAMTCHTGIYNKYLFYYLLSPDFDRYANNTENSKGVAYPAINDDRLYRAVIAIPPLAEQHRIVAKIEELLPYIDRYEEAWSKLEAFNKKFPGDMQKSILQYAIQGKLVEQRPEEGTGEDLYQQIQAEKAELVKTKKIKADKLLPEISADEEPFDIPESWKWVYLGEIFLHNTGKAQNSSGSSNGTMRKFITTSNLYWNEFDFSKVKEMPFTEKELERCTVKKGDLLVCEGGDCGRSAIWNYDEEVCIQNHVHRIRPYIEMSMDYFYYIMYLYKNTGRLRGRGVAIQGLSNEAIHKVIIPLPPLAEQQRIVAKLEELLPMCESLK